MGAVDRRIEPSRDSLDRLLTPLTDGERKVFELFDRKLSIEWEIYVQPHLNGLRPDFVLLHPHVGVAVFEVKDWDLAAIQYYAKSDEGRKVLMARDRNGKHFSREADNPINKILLYKQELFDLYCPRLNDHAGNGGLAAITAGLVFPRSPVDEVKRLLAQFQNEDMQKWPRYHPIVGSEALATGDISAVFPEFDRSSSKVMREETADDLRGWLNEPFSAREQRKPLDLDARQRDLATTRTATGYRRIKGPAGSGKSVVLAARASELAAEGKHVLVVSYNITLLNYLRDLAVRHVARRQVVRRQIDFLNFHRWCKRICLDTGHEADYKRLWRNTSNDGDSDTVLDESLAQLVHTIYSNERSGASPTKYDAILVDEGQDYRPLWWETLRLALKHGGEMVLVADKRRMSTQPLPVGPRRPWRTPAFGARGCSYRSAIACRLKSYPSYNSSPISF